jgi:hypothetical protein
VQRWVELWGGRAAFHRASGLHGGVGLLLARDDDYVDIVLLDAGIDELQELDDRLSFLLRRVARPGSDDVQGQQRLATPTRELRSIERGARLLEELGHAAHRVRERGALAETDLRGPEHGPTRG